MKLNELCRNTNVLTNRAREVLAKVRSCSVSSIEKEEDVTLKEAQAIWDTYPNHTRIVMIQYNIGDDGSEGISSRVLGTWNPQMIQAASQQFNNVFHIATQAAMQGDSGGGGERFRTMPTEQEVEEMMQKHVTEKAQIVAEQQAQGYNEPPIKYPWNYNTQTEDLDYANHQPPPPEVQTQTQLTQPAAQAPTDTAPPDLTKMSPKEYARWYNEECNRKEAAMKAEQPTNVVPGTVTNHTIEAADGEASPIQTDMSVIKNPQLNQFIA